MQHPLKASPQEFNWILTLGEVALQLVLVFANAGC